MLKILLYGCESWIWCRRIWRGESIQAIENKCYRRMFGLSYRHHKTETTNMYGNRSISSPDAMSFHCRLSYLKLSWFDHIRRHDTLPKSKLQGTVDGRHCTGRPRKSWNDNIKEWTGQSIVIAAHRSNDAWASRGVSNWLFNGASTAKVISGYRFVRW